MIQSRKNNHSRDTTPFPAGKIAEKMQKQIRLIV